MERWVMGQFINPDCNTWEASGPCVLWMLIKAGQAQQAQLLKSMLPSLVASPPAGDEALLQGTTEAGSGSNPNPADSTAEVNRGDTQYTSRAEHENLLNLLIFDHLLFMFVNNVLLLISCRRGADVCIRCPDAVHSLRTVTYLMVSTPEANTLVLCQSVCASHSHPLHLRHACYSGSALGPREKKSKVSTQLPLYWKQTLDRVKRRSQDWPQMHLVPEWLIKASG